jgi:hypothetical protein
VFWVGFVYDLILGIAFIVAVPQVFAAADLTPPNHFGYLQFPAGLLLVFALMFLAIARNPMANRNLISYGVLQKLAFCAVAFIHWALGNLPWIWKPFAVIDVVFMVLFYLAYRQLQEAPAE